MKNFIFNKNYFLKKDALNSRLSLVLENPEHKNGEDSN